MPFSSFDFQKNYFQLFGLAQSYRLDNSQLEQQYRELQNLVHPDKHAHATDVEQRVAMQRATLVNEAYQTLRNPLRRARYLLILQGIDTQEETNTAMPPDFLMEQMEWREAVIEAQQACDMAALTELETRLHRATTELETMLSVKIDADKNYSAAAELVRKLRFLEKLAEEIHAAYDAIDD